MRLKNNNNKILRNTGGQNRDTKAEIVFKN